MSLGCRSSWELAWSFKVEREVLIFHPLSTKFEPIHCLFPRSFQVTVMWRGSPWRSSFLWGSRMRHPSMGWPSLVPSTPVQSSEQKIMTFRTSWTSLGSQLAPGLCSLSAIQFQCCLVSEDFFFLAPHQDISKEIFRTILYSVCLVVIRRVIHFIPFIYSGWRPSKNPVLYLMPKGPLQAEFPASWRRTTLVLHLIGGGPPTLWSVICFFQI